MRGGNTNLELWQHCFRMGMSTVCRLCPSPNSWRECYPCRKRGSGGYAGSTNPRAGCGPEARAPRPGGRWSVMCTPKRATDTRVARGLEARALRCGGNSMSDRGNEVLIDRQANAIRIALQRIVLLRETGPKSAAWQRARIKMMWRLRQQLLADTTPRQVDEHDR